MSETGDILEDLEAAVEMLLEGAYSKLSRAVGPSGALPLVKEMGFSVLCALHGRMTRQQMLELLCERIHD